MDPNGATIQAIGWAGNACYFSRFLVQWLRSERAGRSVAPTSFWWCSLGGAVLLGIYSLVKNETPLLLGYIITFFIYLRNIAIAQLGPRAGNLGVGSTRVAAVVAVATLVWAATTRPMSATDGGPWLAIAFLGQAIFSSRFVIQWYATERKGEAHFPRVFWWVSLVGNVMLLAYAIKRGDPIFIAGFLLGPFVQVRNLMLSRSPGDDDPEPVAGPA